MAEIDIREFDETEIDTIRFSDDNRLEFEGGECFRIYDRGDSLVLYVSDAANLIKALQKAKQLGLLP